MYWIKGCIGQTNVVQRIKSDVQKGISPSPNKYTLPKRSILFHLLIYISLK